MEPQQQQQLNNNNQQQNQPQTNEDGGGSSSSKSNNFLCRQSSTRWTPTTDQIRILKDLYYNNGVRSPSADQIQRISARLRQYGKIEGKNVFYWFQNHKARERQKKRFTADIPPMQRGVGSWRSPEDPIYTAKYPNISPGIPSPSPSSSASPGMVALGQMGSYGYGSVTMEKSFRDCSISAGGSGGGSIAHNFWVGADPYSTTYPFFDKRISSMQGNPEEEEQEEEDDEEEEEAPEIETLPLFPMHGEDISGFCNINKQQPDSYYSGSWHHSDAASNKGTSRTSLELSLNSYAGRSSD